LQSIVEQAVAHVRPAIEERRQELNVSLPDEPVRLLADADRLQQALVHLLQNASENTPTGGRIHLSSARGQDELLIRIADNGMGIPPEFQPEIFEPFVRREATIDWSAGRLGIGLSVVRQYVELHGGSVAAESAGPDQGSTFTIRLPLNEPSAGNPDSH
jgi:signal transduction histidine kinase